MLTDAQLAQHQLRFMPTPTHHDRAIEAGQHARSTIDTVVRRPVLLMRGIHRSGRNEFESAEPLMTAGALGAA